MRARRWAAGVPALMVCLGLVGCAKQTTGPNAETTNGDKPNANGQIVQQNTFGDPATYSYVLDLDDADDGNYSFHGFVNSTGGAGSLSSSGALRWFRALAYSTLDVRTLPGTSTVPHGVVVFGKHSIDADTDSERGDVTLYDASGVLVDQLVLASDSSDVFINGAVGITDSSFIAVGGERIAGMQWPLIVQIVVRSGGDLVRGGHAALRTQLQGSFLDIAALPPAGGEIRLFALGTSSNVDRVDAVTIRQATVSPATVDWSRDVQSTLGGTASLDRIAAGPGEVYAAGFTDDNRKGPDAGGNLWDSGLIVSYTTAGVLRWRSVVALTGRSEFFRDVVIGADAVYGIGAAATYIHKNRDQFGYGLVSKLDPATGTPAASFTLGSDRYQARFSTAVLKGADVVAGGWTEYDVLGGPSRGWLVDLNPNPAVPPAPARLAAPSDGEMAPPPDRRRRDAR